MGEMVRCIPDVCLTCKYHGRFGSETRADMVSRYNVCCDYWSIEGHSRRLNDKGEWIPIEYKGYCDKYEKGKKIKPKSTYNPNTRPVVEQFYVGRDGRLHVRDGFRKE